MPELTPVLTGRNVQGCREELTHVDSRTETRLHRNAFNRLVSFLKQPLRHGHPLMPQPIVDSRARCLSESACEVSSAHESLLRQVVQSVLFMHAPSQPFQ